MKLFKRRAKPDEIKTETLTDSDSTDTKHLLTMLMRAPAGTDASSTPTGDAGGCVRVRLECF